MSSDVEPAKKILLPYLQRADELQKHEPLVAYYCRLYAMERGLKIPTKERTKTTSAILVSLMKQLEKDKKSVQLSPEDNLHVEGFALSVFAKADKQDRAGRADLNTAKTFYAASIFIDILHQFGSLQPDIEQKQKYALWKAADIRKAVSEGRKPMPGPPGGDEEFSLSPRGALDLEVRPDNAATRAPEGRPHVQQASNMGFGVGSPSLVGGSKIYTDQALQPDQNDQYSSNTEHGMPKPYRTCMAFALLSHGVCDLTLGKPALPWLTSSASVRDALIVLKLRADVSEISVWDCPPGSHPTSASQSPAHNHSSSASRSSGSGSGGGGSVGGPWHRVRQGTCQCIGKVCMQMIICYLATDQSLRNHAKALDAPLTVLLREETRTVQHIDPEASLLEALGVIAAGAQNLVVQITGPSEKCRHLSKGSVSQKHFFTPKPVALPAQELLPKSHNGREYCWLAHEDVLRFLLGSIGIFSPLPMMSIKDLGIIQTDVLMVGVEDEAVSALKLIKTACLRLTAVAVVESMHGEHGSPKLVGEISCSTLQTCNETAALALAALSVQDFLAYIHLPGTLTEAMCTRIYKKLGSLKGRDQNQHLQEPVYKFMDGSQMLEDLEMWEESSDDEFKAGSPTGPHDLSHKWHLGHFRTSSRVGYIAKIRTGPIFCRPTSSLIAVIMQALAHREHYVWVTKEDDTLVGIVTLTDILSVLSNHLNLSC